MNERQSLIIVIFDLPTDDAVQRRAATSFRKFLKVSGFMQMQLSVYVKRIKNVSTAKAEFDKLRRNSPAIGSVFAWKVSERNFREIQTICGHDFNFALLCDRFFVVESPPAQG